MVAANMHVGDPASKRFFLPPMWQRVHPLLGARDMSQVERPGSLSFDSLHRYVQNHHF